MVQVLGRLLELQSHRVLKTLHHAGGDRANAIDSWGQPQHQCGLGGKKHPSHS